MKTTRTRKVKKKKVWRFVLLLVILGAIYCHFDTQALPKAVDIVSGVIGDKPILWMEECYYGVSGWLNKETYAVKLKLGLEKQHTLVVNPLTAPGGENAPPAKLTQKAKVNGKTKDATTRPSHTLRPNLTALRMWCCSNPERHLST